MIQLKSSSICWKFISLGIILFFFDISSFDSSFRMTHLYYTHAWEFQLGHHLFTSSSSSSDSSESSLDSPTLYMDETKFSLLEIPKYCQSHPVMIHQQLCTLHDHDRIQRIQNMMIYANKESLSKNPTKGRYYHIMTLPQTITTSLQEYWLHHQSQAKVESWNVGDIYTNHWQSPTLHVDLNPQEDEPTSHHNHHHHHLLQSMIQIIQSSFQEWIQASLQIFTYYGIRIYQQGAMIPLHVDLYPSIRYTAMIYIGSQDLQEEWPIQIQTSKKDTFYNLTLLPGQVLLYESMSLIHGRPYPLQGKFYATFYIHFIPLSFESSDDDSSSSYKQQEEENKDSFSSIEKLYKQQHEYMLQTMRYKDLTTTTTTTTTRSNNNNHEELLSKKQLPPFIIPESIEAKQWLQQLQYTVISTNDGEKKEKEDHPSQQQQQDQNTAHLAAIYNDLRALKRIAIHSKAMLFTPDVNGWAPLHEAARAGHTHIVEFLLKQGANVNERTHEGKGESALNIAIVTHGLDHPVVQLLKEKGGQDIPPEWTQQGGGENSKDVEEENEQDDEEDTSTKKEDEGKDLDELKEELVQDPSTKDNDPAEYNTDEL